MSRPPYAVVSGDEGLRSAGLPIAVTEAFWYDEAIGNYTNQSGRRLAFLPVTALDISASALRASVKQGRSIRFLTPAEVVSYIAERRLYRSDA
jgi:nicotinate-nucleotide adenylyltransferase